MSTFRERMLKGLAAPPVEPVIERPAPTVHPDPIDWDAEFPWEQRRAVLVELHAQRLYDRGLSPLEAWTLADEGREPEAERFSREMEAQADGQTCWWCGRALERGLWDVFSVGGFPRFGCAGRAVVTCQP